MMSSDAPGAAIAAGDAPKRLEPISHLRLWIAEEGRPCISQKNMALESGFVKVNKVLIAADNESYLSGMGRELGKCGAPPA